jgi:hypothetical protein
MHSIDRECSSERGRGSESFGMASDFGAYRAVGSAVHSALTDDLPTARHSNRWFMRRFRSCRRGGAFADCHFEAATVVCSSRMNERPLAWSGSVIGGRGKASP